MGSSRISLVAANIFVLWKYSRECEEGPRSFPAFGFHPPVRSAWHLHVFRSPHNLGFGVLFFKNLYYHGMRDRRNYCIRAYHTSFIRHKRLEIVCNPETTFLSRIDTKSSSKEPEVVYSKSFKMNQQQICRGSSLSAMDERYTRVQY